MKALRTSTFRFFLIGGLLVQHLPSEAESENSPASSPTPAVASPNPPPAVAPVNPYGPTTVVPATLTNIGIPEFELFYFVSSPTSTSDRFAQTPFLIKYTIDPRWQINVGGPGLLWQDFLGSHSSGPGDPVASLKYVIKTPDNSRQSTQALQLSYKQPVTNPNLGFSTGRSDLQLTYFYSQDLGKWHLDTNLWLTDIGSPRPDGSRRIQFGDAVGLTIPLTPNFNYELEFHNYLGTGALPTVDNMHIFYWSLRPDFTLSFGVDLGLTKTTPKQTYIVGTVFHL